MCCLLGRYATISYLLILSSIAIVSHCLFMPDPQDYRFPRKGCCLHLHLCWIQDAFRWTGTFSVLYFSCSFWFNLSFHYNNSGCCYYYLISASLFENSFCKCIDAVFTIFGHTKYLQVVVLFQQWSKYGFAFRSFHYDIYIYFLSALTPIQRWNSCETRSQKAMVVR